MTSNSHNDFIKFYFGKTYLDECESYLHYDKLYAMKKKIFTLLFAATMVSVGASSQIIKDNIDKAHNDKNTKEKSAKADVVIQKKIIFDTAQIKLAPQKVISKTPATKDRSK